MYKKDTKQTINQHITTKHRNFQIVDNENYRVYSDGSLTDIGTNAVSGGCGVVITSEKHNDELANEGTEVEDIPRLEANYQLEGQMSSFKTELMGVYATFKLFEDTPGAKGIIYLDNEGVTKKFIHEMYRSKKSILQMIRTDCFPIWDAIRALYRKRRRNFSVEWVKGHADNKGNNRADIIAGQHGQKRTRNTNKLNTPYRPEEMCIMKVVPMIRGTVLESDVRRTVKSIAIINNTIKYTSTKTFLDLNLNNSLYSTHDDKMKNEWNDTMKLINQGTSINSTFTTRAISARRTFMIKAFHELLPTQSVMYERMPLTYNTPYCARCRKEPETNKHMWMCEKATEGRHHVRKRTRNYAKKAFKRKRPTISKHQLSQISKMMSAIKALRTETYDEEDTKAALRRMIRPQFDGDVDAYVDDILKDGQQVEHYHLCTGKSPRVFRTILDEISKHVMATTQGDRKKETATIKFARELRQGILEEIVTESYEKIWKERCSDAVEWELENGITQEIKTNTKKRKKREEENFLAEDIRDEEQLPIQTQRKKRCRRNTSKHVAATLYINSKYGETNTDMLNSFKSTTVAWK